MQLAVKQKWLGPRTFFLCLILINILAILSIDMYIPALPSMQKSFGVTAAYLNLTMFMFFVASAFSIVLAGPASDRFGRKPILLGGCVVFALSSAGCMVAQSVEMLVVFRIGEAIGYGAIATIETALIKDAYEGKDLQLAMTCLQSLIIIGPAFAPFLGTLLLSIGGWREIFAFLTAGGVIGVLLACLVTETHPRTNSKETSGAFAVMFKGVKELVRDKGFMGLALLMGVAGAPYFAFIAVVSYILLDFFAVSYFEYSMIYAAACVVTIIAPYLYIALSKKLSVDAILKLCIGLTGVSFILMALGAHSSPIMFLLTFVPYALVEGVVRPMAFVVLLDQPDHRVGAASSFTNFAYSILTSFGTVMATLAWPTFIFGIVALMAGATVVMLALYLWSVRGRYV